MQTNRSDVRAKTSFMKEMKCYPRRHYTQQLPGRRLPQIQSIDETELIKTTTAM